MKRDCVAVWILFSLCMAVMFATRASAADQSRLVADVLKKLNDHASVRGSEEIKSYKILFDAYLEMTPPPFPIGPDFNIGTIHPKMSDWSRVSGWAESNPKMAQAILRSKEKSILGLPYGTEGLSQSYVAAGLVANVGEGGTLRRIDFPYLKALDTIAAFGAAETYRLMEAGRSQEALNLAISLAFVARQACDREFLTEKLHAISLLSNVLSNMRDVMYLYQEKISADQYSRLATHELPYLRPDRARLFMPEADRIVAEALIQEIFDARSGMPDPQKFAETFAEIQSKDKPLTRFGAAKRWRMIAAIHGSLDASRERLQLIYDDWWRRWRIEPHNPLLDFPTQFERINPIRYAAVVFTLQDIEAIFDVRNQLIVEVNGTAVAAGVCAYKKTFGNYPDQAKMAYTQFMRILSDSDLFDRETGPFGYFVVGRSYGANAPYAVDTPYGRLHLQAEECVIYSRGQNLSDDRASLHSDDGLSGDIVFWPPIKAVSREQGLLW